MSPFFFTTFFNVRFTFDFEGFDLAFTPYIRIQKGKIKQSLLNDIAPENNNSVIIPQIMTKEVDEFVFLAEKLHDLGYEEINWNLGCPYPMVAKRKLGSGMLAYPELLESILEKVIPQIKTKLSIKMRSGYLSDQDYLQVLPVLNQFPLSEIILHPRYAKQLYKGKADASIFEEALKISKHKLAYNGDIDSFEKAQWVLEHTKADGVMIGRGAVGAPWIFHQLKTGSATIDLNIKHSIIMEHYDKMIEFYGPGGVPMFRKHIHTYSKGYEGASALRDQVNRISDPDAFRDVINIFFAENIMVEQ